MGRSRSHGRANRHCYRLVAVYLVANLAMKPTRKLQVIFAFALRLMSESISLLELQPAYNMPDCFRLSRFV